MKVWGHDELASDLADHLRKKTDVMTWENMQIGPAGSPRPDVYVIGKSFAKFRPITYEIKVSVADFRSDITSGKWQNYLKFSSAVIFAVPAGLVSKADIPKGCGLVVRNEDGWRTAKAPTLGMVDTLHQNAWLKLLMDGIDREVRRNLVTCRGSSHWLAEQRLRKRHGQELAKVLSRHLHAGHSIEAATRELEEQRLEIESGARKELQWAIESVKRSEERFNGAYRSLAAALGLESDANQTLLIQRMHEAADRLSGDAEILRLRRSLSNIEAALKEGQKPIPGAPEPKT